LVITHISRKRPLIGKGGGDVVAHRAASATSLSIEAARPRAATRSEPVVVEHVDRIPPAFLALGCCRRDRRISQAKTVRAGGLGARLKTSRWRPATRYRAKLPAENETRLRPDECSAIRRKNGGEANSASPRNMRAIRDLRGFRVAIEQTDRTSRAHCRLPTKRHARAVRSRQKRHAASDAGLPSPRRPGSRSVLCGEQFTVALRAAKLGSSSARGFIGCAPRKSAQMMRGRRPTSSRARPIGNMSEQLDPGSELIIEVQIRGSYWLGEIEQPSRGALD